MSTPQQPENPKVRLKRIPAPTIGDPLVHAPPTLIASTHTIDYECANCGAVLLHAENEQVHNLVIHCQKCGCYNSTDA
jgi:DNA-directed RNA polymerase subunit RPC12/RpoP